MRVAIILACAYTWTAGARAQDAVIQQKIDNAMRTLTVVSGQMFNGTPVKGQPYSAEAVNETTQTLADGNRIVNRSSTTVYRDSDGRERREESMGKLLKSGGAAAKAVFISDPVAKVSYTLHPGEKTAEKIPAPAGAGRGTFQVRTLENSVTVQTGAGRIGRGGGVGVGVSTSEPFAFEVHSDSGGPNGEKLEHLGTQVIEGVAAEGTRTTTTIPAGQIGNDRDINIVSERWFSNELGVLVMSRRSDPRTGETVYKLTNVNRSEPPHSLFEIPADYTVSDGGVAVKTFKLQEDQQ